MHNFMAARILAVALVVLTACGPAESTETETAPRTSVDVEPTASAAGGAAAEDRGAPQTSPAVSAADAVLIDLAVMAPPTTAAPDPNRPLCLICPGVQPDPTQPTVVHKAGTPAPLVSNITTKDPVVFITIDDGEWWNEDAATLLELARVPVTLFLTEQYVNGKLAPFHRLVNAGAWVEPHTATHPNLLAAKNAAPEICGPLDHYEKEFGRRGTLFRPPYGNSNGTTQNVVAGCGMAAVVLWRASTNYGALATQGGELRAGDIILMHFRPDLSDNLVEVFRIINDKGLKVGRLECYVGGDPRCGQPWR